MQNNKMIKQEKRTDDSYVLFIKEWFEENLFKNFTLSIWEYLALIQDIIYRNETNKLTQQHSYLILNELIEIGVLQFKDNRHLSFN